MSEDMNQDIDKLIVAVAGLTERVAVLEGKPPVATAAPVIRAGADVEPVPVPAQEPTP